MLGVPRAGQVDELVADVVFIHHCEMIFDELQGRESVLEVLPMKVYFARPFSSSLIFTIFDSLVLVVLGHFSHELV